MFGFGKSKKQKVLEALRNQVYGAQSVIINTFFVKALEVQKDKIRMIESTYFSLSVLIFVFLRVYQGEEKEQILDDVALTVIETTIPYCGEEISIDQAITEYQKRYKEYEGLLSSLFLEDAIDPNTTLLLYLFKCMVKDSEHVPMTFVTLASPFLYEFVLDNIDFVKNEI